MDQKELKEAIFDMFRKSKETSNEPQAPVEKSIKADSLANKRSVTADEFREVDPNTPIDKLRSTFTSIYFSNNPKNREDLETLLDEEPYTQLKAAVEQDLKDIKQYFAKKQSEKSTSIPKPGASDTQSVRRSGGGFLREQLRMQMLAGIITESEYKSKLNEDEYNDSQAEARLAELANKAFQEVSNYKDLTPELIEEEPGYYRIKFTKPGKLFRKEKTGELHLFVDQNPDTLIMKVIFNGELEQKDTLNWGEGIFADDDAIYEKVAREADKVAMHLMEK